MFDDFTKIIRRFVADECGATAIEYAMIASMLSVAILAAVMGTTGSVNDMFGNVSTKITTALSGG